MRRITVPLLLFATVLVAPMLASPASAQTGTQTALDRAATRLRVDPVYVDEEAPGERKIDPQAQERLRRQIRDAGTPMFVAILPATVGSANDVPEGLYDRVGLPGTYAVVVGGRFGAGSTTLPRGQAAALATTSFQARSGAGTEAVLSDFIGRAATAARTSGGGQSNGRSSGQSPVTFDEGGGSGDGGGGLGTLPLILGAGAVGGGIYLWRRKKKQDAEAAADEQRNRSLLQAELQVLADDVLRLEPQIALHPDAADDYEAAASRYRVAQAALEHADDPIDLVKVERVMQEGRYAMSRAKARIDGRQPPPPPEDLARPGRRGEPALDIDDEGRPAYRGYDGGFYGGGGWFGGGGGGGLLTGLFLGQMLGGFGGFGWGGGGYHETNVYTGDGGDGDGGDGGGSDFGGGDWGGGDFGGGDFGGGDFGGGDIGGGDWG